MLCKARKALQRLNEGSKNVKHVYYLVKAQDKYHALKRVADHNPNIYGIVFCRTRKDTQEIADKLIADGRELDFGIYDESKLSTKDKYAYFLGGNYGRLKIENCGGKGHLLIVKDSFANCLIPFLLPHFDTVTVIDPRFFVGSVSEIITEEAVTETLVLYGADTFMEEKTVPAILG